MQRANGLLQIDPLLFSGKGKSFFDFTGFHEGTDRDMDLDGETVLVRKNGRIFRMRVEEEECGLGGRQEPWRRRLGGIDE